MNLSNVNNITFIGVLLLCLTFVSCESENSQQQPELNVNDSEVTDKTSREIPVESPPPPSLIGKWKHIESRIPNMEPIHMEETYTEFSSNNTVTSSNPNEVDMDDFTRKFTHAQGTITYDQILYSIETLTKDSLVLIHEVDGDQIKMIYKKEG